LQRQEAIICISTPNVPTVPDRQAAKLPDSGAPQGSATDTTQRRAILAGLVTSPQGVLGSPVVSKPTLG
jgi:hypothetical protein